MYVGPVTQTQVHVFYIASAMYGMSAKVTFFSSKRFIKESYVHSGMWECVCKPADGSFIKSCLNAATHSEKVRIKSR